MSRYVTRCYLPPWCGSDRYRALPCSRAQLKFLDLQRELVDDFRIRLTQVTTGGFDPRPLGGAEAQAVVNRLGRSERGGSGSVRLSVVQFNTFCNVFMFPHCFIRHSCYVVSCIFMCFVEVNVQSVGKN